MYEQLGLMALGSLMGGGTKTQISTTQSNNQNQSITFTPSVLNEIASTGDLKPLTSAYTPVDMSPTTNTTANQTPSDDSTRGVLLPSNSLTASKPAETYATDLTPSDRPMNIRHYIPAIFGIITILIIGYVVISGGRKLK